MRELIFSFKWETKNWITSATVIIINEYYNNITITEERDRMKAATISMIWNQLSLWIKELNVEHAKRSNHDV